MARAHVEFVQSQRVAWRDGALGGERLGFAARVLSQDPATGASSAIVRIPAGWRWHGALACDEEFLVLRGALAVDDAPLAAFGYAHLPAGAATTLVARETTIAAWFLDASPMRAAPREYDPRRRVVLDAMAVPYTGNFHPEFPAGAGRKWLFRDPVGGDETWLLATMALRNAARQEVHPVVEEMLLLAGEVHGDRGVMRPGAYFWRPPGIAHGPYGTLTGNLYLFRTVGGSLSTTYIDGSRGFHWSPAYDPVLPPALTAARGEASTADPWQ